MQKLRAATALGRGVLAWFLAWLAIAVATPAIAAGNAGVGAQWICTAGGGHFLPAAPADESALPQKPASADCPLCVAVAPPPAAREPARLPAMATARPLATPPFALAASRAVRPPARGPPPGCTPLA